MKMKRMLLRLLQEKKILVFFVFFFLYVLLGMCISYPTIYKGNIFFGADNARVFGDIINFAANHYRIKVHPLFLILIQPIVFLVKGIVIQDTMAVLLVQSLCGAMADLMFYLIMENLGIEKLVRIFFVIIYGFSFSNIIFSTVPETFIFAGVGLVGFWFFVLLISEKEHQLTKDELCIAVFFGIFSFGVTLTNYVSYLVGLVYLLLKREKGRRRVGRIFVGINFVNTLCIIVLCKIQRFIWNDAPLFWTSISEALFHGAEYEETKYMDFGINFPKTVQWIKQTLFYPLLSPNVNLMPVGEPNRSIRFSGYWYPVRVVAVLFLLAMVIAIVYYVLKLIRGQHRDMFFISMCLAWIGNMFLHYIYGSSEAFIFSPHYYFLFLIMGVCAFNAIENKLAKRSLQIGLMAVVVVEVLNNLHRFFETISLAMEYANASYFIIKSIKGAILSLGVVLIITIEKFYFDNKRNNMQKDVSAGIWMWVCRYVSLFVIIGAFMAFAV